jgi:hypothetical protein
MVTGMDEITMYQWVVIVAGFIGTWIKFQIDYTALKSKVDYLESDSKSFKEDFRSIMEAIQEIKILLAKNKVE